MKKIFFFFCLFSLLISCSKESDMIDGNIHIPISFRTTGAGEIHNDYVELLIDTSTSKLFTRAFTTQRINATNLDSTAKVSIISAMNTLFTDLDEVKDTSLLYNYLDSLVDASSFSTYSKNLLKELNSAKLDSANLERTYLTKISSVQDTIERLFLEDIIDITFRSYEFWEEYVGDNNFIVTLGGNSNDNVQAISVWAAIDRAVQKKLFDRKFTQAELADQRRDIIEAAAAVSDFMRFHVMCFNLGVGC